MPVCLQTTLEAKERQVRLIVQTQYCSYPQAREAVEAAKQAAIDEKATATIAFNAAKVFQMPPYSFVVLRDAVEGQNNNCSELIHSLDQYKQQKATYLQAHAALEYAEGKVQVALSSYDEEIALLEVSSSHCNAVRKLYITYTDHSVDETES